MVGDFVLSFCCVLASVSYLGKCRENTRLKAELAASKQEYRNELSKTFLEYMSQNTKIMILNDRIKAFTNVRNAIITILKRKEAINPDDLKFAIGLEIVKISEDEQSSSQ